MMSDMYIFHLEFGLIGSFGYLYLLSERQKMLNMYLGPTTYSFCFCLLDELYLTSPGLDTTNKD